MSPGMAKAWLAGLCVLLAAAGGWLLLIKLEIYSASMAAILWVSPFVAAFLTSRLAPARPLLLGVSMAVPAALLAVLLNLAPQLSGESVDFPGLRGGLVLFLVVLAGSAVLAALGGMTGLAASGRRDRGDRG